MAPSIAVAREGVRGVCVLYEVQCMHCYSVIDTAIQGLDRQAFVAKDSLAELDRETVTGSSVMRGGMMLQCMIAETGSHEGKMSMTM